MKIHAMKIYELGTVACTFTVILIPRIHTVLDAVANQGVIDAHVAVAKESISFARRWGKKRHTNSGYIFVVRTFNGVEWSLLITGIFPLVWD